MDKDHTNTCFNCNHLFESCLCSEQLRNFTGFQLQEKLRNFNSTKCIVCDKIIPLSSMWYAHRSNGNICNGCMGTNIFNLETEIQQLRMLNNQIGDKNSKLIKENEEQLQELRGLREQCNGMDYVCENFEKENNKLKYKIAKFKEIIALRNTSEYRYSGEFSSQIDKELAQLMKED